MNTHDNFQDLMDAMDIPPSLDAKTTRNNGKLGTVGRAEAASAVRPGNGYSRPVNSGSNLLRLIRSDASVPCYGGYLFRRDNPQCGHVICFAVENMSDEDVINADKWYNLYGRMSHLGVLHRTASAPLRVGSYTIFEFVASADDKSLREHLKAVEPVRTSHTALMADLVRFIYNYRQELEKENYPNYVPLRCLSKDTVLIDSNGRMKILPLRANRGAYPIEIPREVSVGEYADERSDLFSAAYLAVEVYSKNRNCDRLCEPDSDIIRNCLKAIHDWRPSLEEAYAAVCSDMPPYTRPHRFDWNSDAVGDNVRAQSAKLQDGIQDGLQKLRSYVQGLIRPYELEENESDFQLDSTMHDSAFRGNTPLDLDTDIGDSTFGPARH